MLQPVALAHKSLADYTHLVGRPLVDEIRELAEPLQGRRVVHLSATAFGGGVSEILYTLVPLMRDVGLEVEWQVIYGREEFFNATKIMHNALQGNPQDLTEELQDQQRELTETEDRIAAGRRYYNANVRALNTRVESVPSNLVASTFGFHKEEYFEVEDEAVRSAPSVDFT